MGSSFDNQLARALCQGLQTLQYRNHDFLRYPLSTAAALNQTLLDWASKTGFFRHTAYSRKNVDQKLSEIEPFLPGIRWLYERLADEKSKKTLVEVMAYRMLGSRHIRIEAVYNLFWQSLPKVLDSAVTDKRTQKVALLDGWLDDYDLTKDGYPVQIRAHRLNILNTFFLEQYRYASPSATVEVTSGDTVLDGGGCWGDTALYFAHKTGENGKVHVFEFSPSNLELFRQNLERNPSHSPRVQVQPYALWDQSNETLTFDEAGPGTTLGQGKLEAKTQAIDEWARQMNLNRVDFIKLDIEGAEGRTLKGAQSTITSCKPKLAVALYHSLQDFVDLPQWIDQQVPGYQFYLGHSTIHHEETILFCKS